METPGAQVQHWDTWNSKYRQPDEIIDEPSKRREREILRALKTLDVQNAKLLEVGCGTGWLSTSLAQYGVVTAIDLGKEIIDAAKARNSEIDFRSGDVHTIDLALESFDVIVTLETFSHVPDQTAFVERLYELLKPGGFLLLTTQNKFVFDRCEGIKPAVGYLRKWVDLKTLKGLLKRRFVICQSTTLEPEGHIGVLRVVNSRKVTKVCNSLFGAALVKQIRERAGFGQTIFIIARRA